jgi:hypothetical protein
MNAEANTVLRAVAANFFFNCWYLEIPSDNCIRHVPRCVHYHAQGFRLETFQNFYVGNGSRTPELYSLMSRLGFAGFHSPILNQFWIASRSVCSFCEAMA